MATPIKRRRKGEGAIVLRSDGRWMGAIDYGKDERGVRDRRYVYGKSATEVAAAMRRVERDVELGVARPKGDKRRLLGEFLIEWLENVVKIRNRERTFVDYETVVRKHILPKLGRKSLDKLKGTDVQAFYGELERVGRDGGGAGARTRQKVHVLLHQALSYAAKLELINRNPLEHVSAPRYRAQTRSSLSNDQVFELLRRAKGTKVYEALLIACFMGLRQGELLGLQWGDINFEAGTLSIHRSATRSKGVHSLADTKTARSRRNLYMPPMVKNALLERYREAERAATDLVFPNDHGKIWDATRFYRAHFLPLFESVEGKVDMPVIRFHDLRHTTASLLLAAGVHVKVVQEILGHADVNTTLTTYSHLLPTMHVEAMNALEASYAAQSDRIK